MPLPDFDQLYRQVDARPARMPVTAVERLTGRFSKHLAEFPGTGVPGRRIDSSFLLPKISCCLTRMLPTSEGTACTPKSASRLNTNSSMFSMKVINREGKEDVTAL